MKLEHFVYPEGFEVSFLVWRFIPSVAGPEDGC